MNEAKRQAELAAMTDDEQELVAWAKNTIEDKAAEITEMVHQAFIDDKSKEEVDQMLNGVFGTIKANWISGGMKPESAEIFIQCIFAKVIQFGKEDCFNMFGEVAGHA